MQYKTHRNINTNFTFENIYSHVNKYWTNEVINKKEKYTRIWLTILVSTKKNKKYKLINSLPFNTNDITNILVVIKQNYKKNLCNRKDILDNITIKHRFDKNTYITPKPSFFNTFISWLFNYNNTEIKLAKMIFSSK
jgi:predicted patatin/cPLA2 family phospholipase